MLRISLSPSPVHEAFAEIRWDSLLDLTDLERTLLRSGEENPIEYVLSNNEDATDYLQILLKVLDQALLPSLQQQQSSPRSSTPRRRVSRLRIDSILNYETALELLEEDIHGVVKHYVIDKAAEVMACMLSGDLSRVTMASTCFPNGFLLQGWPTLYQVLEQGGSDSYAQRGAAYCLAYLFLEGLRLQRAHKLLESMASIQDSLVAWITSQLQSSGSLPLSIVLPSLMLLIAEPTVRQSFDASGGIGYLSRHMRVDHLGDSKASVQQLYELCFCLWLMSFDVEASTEIRNDFHRDGAVGVLVDLVATSPREKVVRCALATLRNLATCTADIKMASSARRKIKGSNYLIEMVGCGLLKSLEGLSSRQWSDPDIVEDLKALRKLLNEAHRELSTFDVYKSEIESKHLQWGLVHSVTFFRENAKLLEGSNGDFDLVKRLISLIASSLDDDVVAVACFDLGEFVRHYPNGRMVVRGLGAREVVLKAVEHENSSVSTQALLCISKIMIQNWASIR